MVAVRGLGCGLEGPQMIILATIVFVVLAVLATYTWGIK